MLAPYLPPLGWAVVFATVGYPGYRRLVGWCGGRRRLAGLLACVSICALLLVPLVLLAFALTRQSLDAYAAVQRIVVSPDFETLVEQWLMPRLAGVMNLLDLGGIDVSHLRDGLLAMTGQVSSFLVSHTTGLVTGFAGLLFSASLMLIAMYCFFLDGPTIVRRLRDLLPLEPPQEEMLIRRFRDVTAATFYGGVLTALAQGMIGAVIFLSLGLPSPLVWGAAMAVASLIPVVGTALIWAPAAAYFLLTGAWIRGVVLIGLGVLVIGSVDNIVKPLVVRGRMQMHILLGCLGILGGLHLFGLLGLVLGPVILALLMTLVEIYQARADQSMADGSVEPAVSTGAPDSARHAA
jgi:predicted PurR-regulated permease PerM